jgi:UDP-N-acetylglucosamine 4-epimerase
VANAVQANLLALFTTRPDSVNQVYNIACGQQTTLGDLFETIKGLAGSDLAPRFGPERTGDVRHSLADITKARTLLGYQPEADIRQGLKATFEWYRKQHHFGYA